CRCESFGCSWPRPCLSDVPSLSRRILAIKRGGSIRALITRQPRSPVHSGDIRVCVSLPTDTVEGTRQCLPIRERGEEMPVRAIIDKSVPSALTYYSTYLVEPSPAGHMTINTD